MSDFDESDLIDLIERLAGQYSRLRDTTGYSSVDKNVLKSFQQNFYWAQTLSKPEARENLERGVLEIEYIFGGHSSNGLLITSNGYFITSYHCVDEDLERLCVRYQNRRYPIERVCEYDPHSDVALVKAYMPVTDVIPMLYRFPLSHEFGKNIPIALLCLWNGDLVKKFGTINSARLAVTKPKNGKYTLSNQVGGNLSSKPGDSGGIIVSVTNFEVYGILTTGDQDKGVGFCTFWFEALKLITKITG